MDPATQRAQLAIVTAYLKSISGSGPDHIRGLAEHRSIRAVECQSTGCPIAQLVWGATGISVSVSQFSVALSGIPAAESIERRSDIPEDVAQFISNFDIGDYPELLHHAPVPA